ncbi:tetratricopeptide repeat protein [Stieleria sp. TO1_6]|uniref:tetratricopeptide repeat protein n=1 Tax=Stieleria tagensis TaxID=2956795 RepID=UPI00209AE7C6|nr:tetratricopeptide repeat protein [Stieleria tagensis]MCO8120304.1 tetratricopeptide repeat protein [Stieleria tagensis]
MPAAGSIRFVATAMLLAGCVVSLTVSPNQRVAAAESTEESIALYADAANFQTSGALGLAIESWNKFLQTYPDDDLASKAAHYLGVCYMQQEKPDYVAAAKAFSVALTDKEYELREESLANQGWCYYASAGDGPQRDAEKLKQTIATFDLLRKENPKSDYIDRAYFYSGEAAYGLGRREEAVDLYDRFLALPAAKDSPLRCDALYARGIAQEELKQSDKAVASFKQLLSDCPDGQLAVDVQLRLGDLMIMQRQFPAAVEAFEKAIASSKQDADKSYAIFRQAYALVQDEKPAQAGALYDRLQNEFPDSPYAANATLASGQSFYRGGQTEQAAERFEKVLTQNNAAAATEAAHWLARIRLAAQDAPGAISVARQQIKSGAEGDFAVDLRVDLAEALAMNPDTTGESIQIAEQVFRDAPDDPLAPRALYNAAFSALQLNQFDQANGLASEFLAAFPNDALAADVRFIIAESDLLMGKTDLAIKHYKQLLEQAPADNLQRPLWVLRTAVAMNSGKAFADTIKLLRSEQAGFKLPAQQAEAEFLIGQAQLLSAQPADAAKAFAAAAKADPQWSRAGESLLLQGTALLSAGDSAQAKQTWSQLVERESDSAMADQARYKLAQLASNSGDHPAAIKLYDQIIAADRDTGLIPYAIYGLGWSQMQQGDHQQAVETLGKIVTDLPNHPLTDDALLARGISNRSVGDLDAAKSDLTKYLELKPTGNNLGHALYELALVDQKQDRHDQVVARLNELVQKVPDYPAMDKVLYELGWSLRESGDDPKAAEQFVKLLKQFPDTPLAAEAAYFVGQQEYSAGEWAEAADHFRIAADQTTDDAMGEKALYRLGWSLYKDGKLDQAKQAFEQQASKHPSGKLAIDAVMMAGECLFKKGQYEPALAAYVAGREKIQLADDNADTVRDPAERQVRELILLHGGQSAAQLKQWDDAIGWYDELKQRFPATAYLPQVFYETGFAYQQKNDLPQALKYFGQVAEQYRRSEVGARARFMMGEIHFGEKQFDQAIPEFQRVMYGFGGEQAADEIKNWQAKSGFEAGRCSELLMQSARTPEAKSSALKFATQFYQYVVGKHPGHDLAKKSAERLEALQRS